MNIALKGDVLKYVKVIPGVFDIGFTSEAFKGLVNLINANPSMYYYYGSETKPECLENVFWQVFAEARSMSQSQFRFLMHQLVFRLDGTKADDRVASYLDVFGNKRNAQYYNPNQRDFIKYNPNGSMGVIS